MTCRSWEITVFVNIDYGIIMYHSMVCKHLTWFTSSPTTLVRYLWYMFIYAYNVYTWFSYHD